ncbi:MAG: hypothetical protein GTO40_15260 [Deltaproteobacteria bacterium]|nr:hypothetical protein [Deltaproteobacteria bacterium]
MARFEEEIGNNEYLAGDFSLVDADLIPRFNRLADWGLLSDPAFPRLQKWHERMKSRPSVKEIL